MRVQELGSLAVPVGNTGPGADSDLVSNITYTRMDTLVVN